MTLLEQKTVRDERGIDTLERALVYAAVVLRAANTAPGNITLPGGKGSKHKNAVRVAVNFANITQSGIEPLLSLAFKFPYDNQQALKRGGVFIEHVGNLENVPTDVLMQVESTFRSALLLPSEPTWVTTLERYATWIATLLIKGHLTVAASKAPPISVNFLEEDPDEPSITIAATLKLDYEIYLATNNLVAAVLQQVPVPTGESSGVTRQSSLYVAMGTP